MAWSLKEAPLGTPYFTPSLLKQSHPGPGVALAGKTLPPPGEEFLEPEGPLSSAYLAPCACTSVCLAIAP